MIEPEEEFNQGGMNLKLLLMLDLQKVYEKDDLDYPETLIRSLRLLYRVLLVLDPRKMYEADDLEEPKTLVCALTLL